VVGRTDDVVSVGGRKVHARELEAAVDLLGDVRHGRSVLVDHGGRGELVLMVELRRRAEDPAALAAAAAAAIMAKSGVALTRCLFLERNALPLTPSGKIQRFRSRMLLQNDQLAPVATVDL
jgi:fatty-acyl-CoA synthase